MVVRYAKPAAEIDELQFHTHFRKFLGYAYHHFCGTHEWFDIEDLRPDMAVDSYRLDIAARKGFPIGRRDLPVRIPNLLVASPVAIFGCVGTSRAGFTRNAIFAVVPAACAAVSSWWSSSRESTETFIPFSMASFRSAGVFGAAVEEQFFRCHACGKREGEFS